MAWYSCTREGSDITGGNAIILLDRQSVSNWVAIQEVAVGSAPDTSESDQLTTLRRSSTTTTSQTPAKADPGSSTAASRFDTNISFTGVGGDLVGFYMDRRYQQQQWIVFFDDCRPLIRSGAGSPSIALLMDTIGRTGYFLIEES